MGLIQRKSRPICRNEESLRDDRLFIIASDDTYAPKQYFSFFKIARVQVHVIPTEDGTSSAQHVLGRLLEVDHEEDDELWMLLDTDHYTDGSHVRTFISAIKKAKQKGVKVALSKPCFELWLLLHHCDIDDVISLNDAQQTGTLLNKVLGGYNKRKLKLEHYPETSVAKACGCAKALDKSVSGGVIPSDNTSRVYLLWEAIISSSPAYQFVPEFKEFLEG